MKSSASDIIIIGAGVVGLSTALQLSEQGVQVTVVDRQRAGSEASWAGAGMLPPGNLSLATTPEARLRAFSGQLWPRMAQQLLEETGIDNGYRRCGAVETATPETLPRFQQHLRDWQQEHIDLEMLSRSEMQRYVPGLSTDIVEACFLPDFAQVRNPRHLQALRAACVSRGVRLIEHAQNLRLTRTGDRRCAATLDGVPLPCHRLCLTAGAWSASLLQTLGLELPVRPVRGQIVQLQTAALPFRCVIEMGRRYLVPRPDGLILVGSTEEHAGFCKQNTVEGIVGLLQFACELVPALKHADVARTWAGLRPQSPDELPVIGQAPGIENLYVGTGHFRSGLQMSPGTAVLLTAMLLQQPLPFPADGLEFGRFASPSEESAASQ